MRTPGLRSVRLAGMAGTDPADEIAALTSTLDSIEAVLDPGEMQREAADLREQSADPDLWADQDRAQKVGRRLSYLEAELTRLTGLRQRLGDTQVLFDLAESENDEPTKQEAAGELAALRTEVDQLEVRTLLNGEYDAREALISINAQAGGADAADFAENLLLLPGKILIRGGDPRIAKNVGHRLSLSLEGDGLTTGH